MAYNEKNLGAFYTPIEVAQSLTDWAIRGRNERVLDPSFGKCAFLAASISTLRRLGTIAPFSRLAGVDVDKRSLSYLRSLDGYHWSPRWFRIGQDFLQMDPAKASGWRFEAVVANPPYVRHHDLTSEQIETAQRSLEQMGVKLSKRASYWAYFVVHSLNFLQEGGRTAMVLPLSLLSCDYAEPIRNLLAQEFRSTKVILVRQRLFQDAEEGSVVVLADGWRHCGQRVQIRMVKTPRGLARACGKRAQNRRGVCTCPQDWATGLLPADIVEAYGELLQRKAVRRLGDMARIKIGIVTGGNAFFVLSPSEARARGIGDRYLHPALVDGKQVRGLILSHSDMDRFGHEDMACRLLIVPKGSLSSAVEAYLSTPSADTVKERRKCQERNPWYRITDRAAPDAFLTYVVGDGPRLCRNDAGALCTNAIHRLWWQDCLSDCDQKLLLVSFMSSLTRLSCEVAGRFYGGGALKLELSEAREVAIAMPRVRTTELQACFAEVNSLLIKGRWRECQIAADELVLRAGLRLRTDEIVRLRHGTQLLRLARAPA